MISCSWFHRDGLLLVNTLCHVNSNPTRSNRTLCTTSVPMEVHSCWFSNGTFQMPYNVSSISILCEMFAVKKKKKNLCGLQKCFSEIGSTGYLLMDQDVHRYQCPHTLTNSRCSFILIRSMMPTSAGSGLLIVMTSACLLNVLPLFFLTYVRAAL